MIPLLYRCFEAMLSYLHGVVPFSPKPGGLSFSVCVTFYDRAMCTSTLASLLHTPKDGQIHQENVGQEAYLVGDDDWLSIVKLRVIL
jgi:hypothetical protein